MDFRFNDNQILFAEATKEMLTTECTASRLRQMIGNEEGTISGVWANLASIGVLGMTGPERVGGLEMTDIDLVLIMEELGNVICPETVIEHTAIGIPFLSKYGEGKIGDDLLADFVSGKQRISVGLCSLYVLNADSADYFLMKNVDEIHFLPRKDTVLTFQKSIDETRRLFRVEWEPADGTIITKSEQVLEETMLSAATATAAQCLGIASHLLKETISYVKEREQFGKPVGVNQAIKHHLADTGKAIEFARPMVHRAAWAISNEDDDRAASVAMAKYLASKAVDHACRTALQCHGAIAYTIEYDLQLWMKRGWALSAAWGDMNSQRNKIAENLGV
ncbi:MAG: acyl-CoA dehydrogenase family protein [Acidimicrobiales bacterium]|nr:acyl-CoA dehydrogenase family protein [Acidimicrobiales bacterium]